MLAYGPQDPAEAGVTTALERARTLHDKVRAAANRTKSMMGPTRRAADELQLSALCFIRDRLAVLEDRLREYRLLGSYDTQAKTTMLCQLDASRRELMNACNKANVLHQSDQALLVKEVLAFCEMSQADDGSDITSFADAIHRLPRYESYDHHPLHYKATAGWDVPHVLRTSYPAETAMSVVDSTRDEPTAVALSEASESLGQYGGKLNLRPFATAGAMRASGGSGGDDKGPRAVELLKDQYFPRFRHQDYHLEAPYQQHLQQSWQQQQQQCPPYPQQQHPPQQQFFFTDAGSKPRSPVTPPVIDSSLANAPAPAERHSQHSSSGSGGKAPGLLKQIGKAVLTFGVMAAAGVAASVVMDAETSKRRKPVARPQLLPLDALLMHNGQGVGGPDGSPLLMPYFPHPDISIGRG